MLDLGIIERSYTPYINPLVIVVKKDLSVRICLDARELNKQLQEDHEGPEPIEVVFKRFCEGGVLSSIDLTASFRQIPLAKESREYTGFMYHGRVYHFGVISFGTNVSTGALVRASRSIFEAMEDRVIDFVDDWTIMSKDEISHIKH